MKIAIIGAAGRMGQTLVRMVQGHIVAELVSAVEHTGSSHIGNDSGLIAGIKKTGVLITDDTESAVKEADALIDFTVPEASLALAKLANIHGKSHIIGTTGMSDAQIAELKSYTKNATIVFAPNMSIGVNILFNLVEKVAATLDTSYDIEILEMHHKHKIDAPSGTALGLGKAAARGRKVNLDDVAQRTRDGHTGARREGDIGFATLRGGDVVGDHTVIFAGDGDRIELTHKASDRNIFAKGAIHAALWTEGKSAGLYSMQDVLGL